MNTEMHTNVNGIFDLASGC